MRMRVNRSQMAARKQYIRYYHEDRTHLTLEKGTPGERRAIAGNGRVLAIPRVAGLHHRYELVA
jgi:hypothetical protein